MLEYRYGAGLSGTVIEESNPDSTASLGAAAMIASKGAAAGARSSGGPGSSTRGTCGERAPR
jgi:hypothetical protein